jgi:hypothetical protein
MTREDTMMKTLRVKSAAVALGASVLGTLFAGQAAYATSSGCTKLGGWKTNVVCVSVVGDGLKVEQATASVTAPIGGVTNWELRLTFFDRQGHQYAQYKNGYHSGTAFSPVYKIKPNKNFREGKVCASVSENGNGRPGACVSLYP